MNSSILKTLREKSGFSRKVLAKKLYVTESVVQSWEEGWYIAEPSYGELEEMAEVFNLTEYELIKLLELENNNNDISFIDFVDAGFRTLKNTKKNKFY